MAPTRHRRRTSQPAYAASNWRRYPTRQPTPALAAGIRRRSPIFPKVTVLDLGSGGGIDVLLSARRVGPTGFVYGLDMTDEMLELARANAIGSEATNVEFIKGYIEDIPLDAGSIDVVISNCVINLSTDKSAVFDEIHRVLRVGGRVGITDIVANDFLSPTATR